MIKYYENEPFCIIQQKEAGISINFSEIISYIKFIEPKILENNTSDATYSNQDLSSRFYAWNIFMAPVAELMPVYELINFGYEKFKKELQFKDQPLWIHAHGNIHRKNQQLMYHAHKYFLLGYISLSAEGSNTNFYLGKDNTKKISIPNKDGQLVMALGQLPHDTDVWKHDNERCSIAFNLITLNEMKLHSSGPVFPFRSK